MSSTYSSPKMCLHVIYPPSRGGWNGPYNEDTSTLTQIPSRSFDDILRLVERIYSFPAFADRVRTLQVNLVPESPTTRDLSLRLNMVFPRLQKLQNLLIEGCLENDFYFLEHPVSFSRLTSLTCDFSPSQELERFFLANPTIKDLCFLGADFRGHVEPGKTLPWPALPRLEYLQCDIFFLRYFLPHRPLQWVMPRRNVSVMHRRLDSEIMSLRYSTANGGIECGGGVKSFWLGCNYPLARLAYAAPNLQHLYILEEDGPSTHIWNTPGWEQGLAWFQNLRNISVRTLLSLPAQEQGTLVSRWSPHAPLRCIVFSYGQFTNDNPLADAGAESDSEGSRNAVEGSDDGSDSRDGSGQGITKWVWDQEAGIWGIMG